VDPGCWLCRSVDLSIATRRMSSGIWIEVDHLIYPDKLQIEHEVCRISRSRSTTGSENHMSLTFGYQCKATSPPVGACPLIFVDNYQTIAKQLLKISCITVLTSTLTFPASCLLCTSTRTCAVILALVATPSIP
jgi:hypothetical protein